MKTMHYLLLAAAFLGSCAGVKVKQHNLPCHTRSRAEVLQSAMSLLVQHGFTITLADTTIGLVQAETEESRNIWSGANGKRMWQISIRPELGNFGSVQPGEQATLTRPIEGRSMFVVATARTVTRTTNAYGATLATAEEYYDDNSHSDWEWYWGVRSGLESLCGAKVVISTKSLN